MSAGSRKATLRRQVRDQLIASPFLPPMSRALCIWGTASSRRLWMLLFATSGCEVRTRCGRWVPTTPESPLKWWSNDSLRQKAPREKRWVEKPSLIACGIGRRNPAAPLPSSYGVSALRRTGPENGLRWTPAYRKPCSTSLSRCTNRT